MKNSEIMSTEEVARILGVGVSTVKRWVDRDILPAHRTCGGHRRILVADVVRLARQGRLPEVDLTRLPLLDGAATARSIEDFVRQLYKALIDGDEKRMRDLFSEMHAGGMAIETLADDVVRPALQRIGLDWSDGQIDVMHEHRGMHACVSALCALKYLLVGNAAPTGPLAIGGAPEKDPYLLPCILAELVLLDAGWQVINLGPNTPLPAFERALEEFRPRLLWLSITHLEAPTEFIDGFSRLNDCAARKGTEVVIGGRAVTYELRAALPPTNFGEGLRRLSTIAHSLHAVPQPPQRGRPRDHEFPLSNDE